VLTFPTIPSQWYAVSVTNNIIDNNVAGWDGAGISLYDALNVNIVNNTIESNDSTASSGVLFDTIGNPTASVPGTNCLQTGSTTLSCPQPAGIVSIQNSSPLTANLPATVICPAGHGSGGTGNGGLTNGSCRKYSVPVLTNDIVWHNRSFNISVGKMGDGTLNQQNVVALLPTLNQTSTGQCVTSSNYWDIGVRGDTGPANHSGGTLAPAYSLITDAADYPGANNVGSDPAVVSPYCNGARTPPELHTMGYQVPPGIADATVPNPVFNLTPAATVDEGNNWVNISWGPLALATPAGTPIGNYALTGGSPAIDVGTERGAPSTDFFGNTRPQGGEFDIGAVEFVKAATADLDVAPQSLAFGSVARGHASATQFVTLSNAGGAPLTVTSLVFTAGFARATGFGLAQNCPTTANFVIQPGSTCRVYMTFTPATLGAVAGSLTINSNDTTVDAAADRVVALSGNGTRLFVSPNALAFLTLNANLSLPQTVTVTNVGPGVTGAISFPVTGNTNGVVFTATSTTCTAGLAPNASCTISVRFRSPTIFTLGTATLTVSDPTEPAAGTVALTGFRLF
jgi:Abnormal spindle-like microcephaly-assoc'd, ASPM-SPD-2-Hydin